MGQSLTAFATPAGNSVACYVHFSPDGENLDKGPVAYQGVSPVTAMSQYARGANGGEELVGDPTPEELAVGIALFEVAREFSKDVLGPFIEHYWPDSGPGQGEPLGPLGPSSPPGDFPDSGPGKIA